MKSKLPWAICSWVSCESLSFGLTEEENLATLGCTLRLVEILDYVKEIRGRGRGVEQKHVLLFTYDL